MSDFARIIPVLCVCARLLTKSTELLRQNSFLSSEAGRGTILTIIPLLLLEAEISSSGFVEWKWEQKSPPSQSSVEYVENLSVAPLGCYKDDAARSWIAKGFYIRAHRMHFLSGLTALWVYHCLQSKQI